MTFLHLKRGETLVGVIEVTTFDRPFFSGEWWPTVDFWEYKTLFDQLSKAVETDGTEEITKAQEQIDALGLRLVNVETKFETNDFSLHIKDERAWLRYPSRVK